jgi:group I intron endonuclease
MSLVYIYAYENKINGKIYIGQTNNISQRDSEHIRSKKLRGIDGAIKKYGRENFEYFTVQIIESFEEADAMETFWITEMRRLLERKNVYNIADGGRTNRAMHGKDHPQWGKPMNPEICKKISNTLKGKFLGKKLSQAHIKHISEGKMGAKNPNFGKHPSPETIEKLRVRSGGENNGRAKLTANDVSEIRKLLRENNKSVKDISMQFNISYCTIKDIKNERTWKNVK